MLAATVAGSELVVRVVVKEFAPSPRLEALAGSCALSDAGCRPDWSYAAFTCCANVRYKESPAAM